MTTIEYLRQFTIGDYAIFDLTISFLGMFLLSPILSKLTKKIRLEVPKRNWVILTLPIGIIAHLLVGNMTPMTRDVIALSGNYTLKAVILALVFFSIKGVKKIPKNKKPTAKN